MTDSPETILERVEEIEMYRSDNNTLLGTVEVRHDDFRFLVDQLRKALTKTVLCGNCGARYQSPMQDGEHGKANCSSTEGL